MGKKANKYGGGAQTNANGLKFEQETSLDEALENAGYYVMGNGVYNKGDERIGYSTPKRDLYTQFLNNEGVDYRDYNSKQWLPDECFINDANRTAYIIEKKFQNTSGSVDEKLPGCDFKKREYEKLFRPIDYGVEYLYVFNDWFKKEQYRDTLDYIEEVGCRYFFNKIPLDFLGLSDA